MDIVSLSTDVAAPTNVARDLMDAVQVGKGAYPAFKRERMESDIQAPKLYGKMTEATEDILRHWQVMQPWKQERSNLQS